MAASEELDARPVRAFLPDPDLQIDESSLVIAWRQFMRDPQSYFRHLFGD